MFCKLGVFDLFFLVTWCVWLILPRYLVCLAYSSSLLNQSHDEDRLYEHWKQKDSFNSLKELSEKFSLGYAVHCYQKSIMFCYLDDEEKLEIK